MGQFFANPKQDDIGSCADLAKMPAGTEISFRFSPGAVTVNGTKARS